MNNVVNVVFVSYGDWGENYVVGGNGEWNEEYGMKKMVEYGERLVNEGCMVTIENGDEDVDVELNMDMVMSNIEVEVIGDVIMRVSCELIDGFGEDVFNVDVMLNECKKGRMLCVKGSEEYEWRELDECLNWENLVKNGSMNENVNVSVFECMNSDYSERYFYMKEYEEEDVL